MRILIRAALGRFDRRTGHYADNVVVVAMPQPRAEYKGGDPGDRFEG